MESKPIQEFIELAAIIIGAIFGILGSTTDTKNKTGKLTKWGIIAVVGIILTNSLSLILTYLKQKNDKENAIAVANNETKKAREQQIKYSNEIAKIDSVLGLDTSSQHKLLKLQKKTGLLLYDLNNSVDTQNKILKTSADIDTGVKGNLMKQDDLYKKSNFILVSQKTLLAQQQKVDSNVIRTLNPLTPFGISFTIRVNIHDTLLNEDAPNDYVYQEYTKANAHLDKIFSKYHNYGHFGITTRPVRGPDKFACILQRNYRYKSDFLFLQKIPFQLDIYRKDLDINNWNSIYVVDKTTKKIIRKDGDVSAKINSFLKNDNQRVFAEDSQNENYMFPGIYVTYRPEAHKFYITFFTNDFIFDNNDSKLKSVNDLSGGALLLELKDSTPAETDLVGFAFHFPPLYSNTYNLTINPDQVQANLKNFYLLKIKD